MIRILALLLGMGLIAAIGCGPAINCKLRSGANYCESRPEVAMRLEEAANGVIGKPISQPAWTGFLRVPPSGVQLTCAVSGTAEHAPAEDADVSRLKEDFDFNIIGRQVRIESSTSRGLNKLIIAQVAEADTLRLIARPVHPESIISFRVLCSAQQPTDSRPQPTEQPRNLDRRVAAPRPPAAPRPHPPRAEPPRPEPPRLAPAAPTPPTRADEMAKTVRGVRGEPPDLILALKPCPQGSFLPKGKHGSLFLSGLATQRFEVVNDQRCEILVHGIKQASQIPDQAAVRLRAEP